jgi:hypothetical protein
MAVRFGASKKRVKQSNRKKQWISEVGKMSKNDAK